MKRDWDIEETEEESEITWVCICCNSDMTDDDDTNDTEDGNVCNSCYSSYEVCEYCGDHCHEDNMNAVYTSTGRYRRSVNYCNHCYRNANTCGDCNDRFTDSAGRTEHGEFYCDSCAENRIICEECGDWTHVDSATSSDDGWYCNYCYRRQVIKPYDFKPTPDFFGVGPTFFGVELEVDGGGENPRNAEKILDVMNKGDERIYIKHDGSLYNGFELVSHPATLDAHMGDFDWEGTLNAAKVLGYKSHEPETCGLHVHISRKAFGRHINEQEQGIMKLLYIVEKFWDELVYFSRRSEEQLTTWAARYGMANTPEELLDNAKHCYRRRYHAVNLENDNTVEIRIFRGTLCYKTFLASIQICQVIADVANEKTVREIQQMTWDDFTSYGAHLVEFSDYCATLKDVCMVEGIAG